jgi:hypothetical protein
MNFLERRTLGKAQKELRPYFEGDEQIMDFDLANSLFFSLPARYGGYMSLGSSKRIPLAASNAALYVTYDKIIRIPWSELVLCCYTESLFIQGPRIGESTGQIFLNGLVEDGSTFQIHTGRGSRHLAEIGMVQIAQFEATLKGPQIESRESMRSDRLAKMAETSKPLRDRQFPPAKLTN